MVDPKLDIASWNYDRTRTPADGTVKIDGVSATFHTAKIVTEISEGMVKVGLSGHVVAVTRLIVRATASARPHSRRRTVCEQPGTGERWR